jgi:hypothetical protein
MLLDFTALIVDTIAHARKLPIPLTTLVDIVRRRAYGFEDARAPHGISHIIKQRDIVRKAIIRAEAEGDIVSCSITGGDGYKLAEVPVDEPRVHP